MKYGLELELHLESFVHTRTFYVNFWLVQHEKFKLQYGSSSCVAVTLSRPGNYLCTPNRFYSSHSSVAALRRKLVSKCDIQRRFSISGSFKVRRYSTIFRK